MASKPLIVATLVGASVGVPYFASHAQHGTNGTAATAAQSSASGGAGAGSWWKSFGASTTPTVASGGGVSNSAVASAADGARFTSVAQVFRFDVTKEWVCRSWSR